MVRRPIRIRRGRRTDFAAVMELLASSGTALPVPDRSTLRRFRQLVADLGCDFYLATIDERVVGVAHVTYARQLARAPRATLATLVVGGSERRLGVGTALIQFVATRARQRTCDRLQYALPRDHDVSVARFLQHSGGRSTGAWFEIPLTTEE